MSCVEGSAWLCQPNITNANASAHILQQLERHKNHHEFTISTWLSITKQLKTSFTQWAFLYALQVGVSWHPAWISVSWFWCHLPGRVPWRHAAWPSLHHRSLWTSRPHSGHIWHLGWAAPPHLPSACPRLDRSLLLASGPTQCLSTSPELTNVVRNKQLQVRAKRDLLPSPSQVLEHLLSEIHNTRFSAIVHYHGQGVELRLQNFKMELVLLLLWSNE